MASVLGCLGAKQYAALEKGAVVELVAEPDNPTDEKAVAVYLEKDKVGYLANSKETVLPETMSATRLQPLISNDKKVCKVTALLGEPVPYTAKSGTKQKRFYAEVFFVPKRAARKKQKVEEGDYRVAGSTTRCPRRNAVLKMITEGIDKKKPTILDLTVKREGAKGMSKYLVYELGQDKNCGEIDVPKGDIMEKWFDQNPELTVKTTGVVEQASSGYGQSFPVHAVFSSSKTVIYDTDIDAAIARGAGQEPELQEKVKFLSSAKVTPEVIQLLLKSMRAKVDMEKVPPQPLRPYKSKTDNLNDALAFTIRSKPLRFIGNKGSGKNTLIETVCWLMNQPMIRVQGSSELDKMDILGSPQLDEGNTSFQLSPLMEALRDGATVIIDEANLVRPEVLGILHSATDTARSVLVPGYGLVKLHPNSQIIYTMNEGYTGTADMNEATVDRCPTFELEPEVNLTEILAGFPANKVGVAQKVSDDIRKAVEEGTLSPDAITIRGYIDALEMSDLVPLKRALIKCVAGKVQEKSTRDAIVGIIGLYCK